MNKTVTIEGQLTIKDCALASDGGSKFLSGTDEKGNTVTFLLPQHVMPENFSGNSIPGRLHVNGQPLEIRSEAEKETLEKLKNAVIDIPVKDKNTKPSSFKGMIIGQDLQDYYATTQKGPNYAIGYILKGIIDFVESDEYVKIANNF